MYILWIIVSVVLAVVWLCVLAFGIVSLFDEDLDKDEFRVFSAVMAGALIFVLFHWIVLLLAIPAFFVYGLFQAIRLGLNHFRKSLTPTE